MAEGLSNQPVTPRFALGTRLQRAQTQDCAMNSHITGACSINSCPNPATTEEVGESEHWRFVVHYCQEHQREIEKGTPVGPVGIDVTRIEVRALGTEEPALGGIMPSIGPG